jgi:mono/diheme cytochrome c family protein
MFNRRSLIACFIVAGTVVTIAQQTLYNVGKPASAKEIRARNLSVAPDGTGLPPGRGTALTGRAVYQTKCARCHGERGEGHEEYPALAGGIGTLVSNRPSLTVGSYWPYSTTIWDYIRRAMPYQQPGSLTPDEVYSVTAYILYMNRIIGERDELNQKTLPEVKMPNRDGFVSDPRPDVK